MSSLSGSSLFNKNEHFVINPLFLLSPIFPQASQDETVKNLPWLDSTAKDQHVQQEAG